MGREGNTESTSDVFSLNGPDSVNEEAVGEATTATRSFAQLNGLGIGTVIDGKYTIESVLGEGGMGLVFGAEHMELRERVALKFLVSNMEGFDFRARFRREAQICAKIRNEHITRVIDVGSWHGAAYMVMEHLSGSDLGTLVAEKGRLSIDESIAFAVQLCSGLAEVHANGIVHRDLKPSNLFVTKRADGTPLVKLLDFGISKWSNEPDNTGQGLTKIGTVLGTPEYMAPEQLFGSNTVDARADIWAIGAILYELMTGTTPFTETTFAKLCAEFGKGEPPKSPRVHRPDLPAEIDAAIMLCLQPDLSKRIPNVAALAGELLAALHDATAEPTRLRIEAALERGPRSSRPSLPSSGSMRSGDYIAISLRESSASLNPVSDPTKASSQGAVIAVTGAGNLSRGKLKIAGFVGGVTALALAGYLAFGRSSAPPAEARVVPPPALPSIAAPATSATHVVESPAPAATPAAAPPVASASAVPVSIQRPAATVTKKALPPPPPSAVVTAAASTAPIPPPPAAPPPKPANPLEDRQ